MQNYLLSEDDGLLLRPAGAWTAKKLDYLTRYIEIFETAMRDKWGARNYIDLLSGPGKNRIRNSKKILLGSPLIALTTPHPFTGYYFVELSEQNKDALEQWCNSSPFFHRVKLYSGDCNVVVNEITSELKRNENRSLNLAFLDPEGLELQWKTVARLASIKRMDIILYYPELGLNLNMRKLYQAEGETAIDLFFGGRNWRDIFAHHQDKVGLHRLLIDLYKSNLVSLGYTEVFLGDEEVGEPLIRNRLRNAPLYRLIFASKHNLGHKFWHEVIQRDISGQISLPFGRET